MSPSRCARSSFVPVGVKHLGRCSVAAKALSSQFGDDLVHRPCHGRRLIGAAQSLFRQIARGLGHLAGLLVRKAEFADFSLGQAACECRDAVAIVD